ncbi:MAG TPA: helix-turn-helix transcriptional regulator [Candidatus Ventricola gallistercoris]|nr:helix-turn-helix transcriptional regulator [Candidatus Ventricola gallistercoris]
MRPIELAEVLGVVRQNIGAYIHGQRALGPTMLPVVAEALGVSQAYLRGIADRLPVYDWESGKTTACPIMSETDIDGYGSYYIVDHPEIGWMAVIMSVGIQFTPRDWQGAQPLSVEDIASTEWVDYMGREAIMLDGLPRVLAG